MYRMKVMGLTVVAVMAFGVAVSSSASAHPKLLEVTAGSHGIVHSNELLTFEWHETFGLYAHGEQVAVCEEKGAEGHLLTNSAKTDAFALGRAEEDPCYGITEHDLGSEGQIDIVKLNVAANGKASGSVEITFSGPSPYQHCVYKSSKLTGANSTSGELEVKLSGNLKGAGCHERAVKLEEQFPGPLSEANGFGVNLVLPPQYPELDVAVT
jgi:hypothetical protein